MNQLNKITLSNLVKKKLPFKKILTTNIWDYTNTFYHFISQISYIRC